MQEEGGGGKGKGGKNGRCNGKERKGGEKGHTEMGGKEVEEEKMNWGEGR